MRHPKSSGRILALLGFLLLLFFLLSLALGSEPIPLKDTILILLRKLPFLSEVGQSADISPIDDHIIRVLRLPRALGAVLVGMALSSSGLIFQSTLQNPMADPFMLGISAGAAFGASLSFLLPQFPLSTTMAAFLGAVGSMLFVYPRSRRRGKILATQLILTGIALSMLLSSFVSLFMALHHEKVDKILFWTMGSLASIGMKQVYVIMLPMVLAWSIFVYYTRDLNLMLMGEEGALSTGSDVHRVRMVLLFSASLLTAMAVSVSGIIGFVGLVIPHAMRLLIGVKHERLLPATLLAGGAFLLISDLLARVLLAPAQLPLGVVTAMLGSPYFLFLLRRRSEGGGM